MKINIDATKIIGVAATIVGLGATILSNVASDKKLKSDVAKEVAKEVAKQLEK